MRTSIFKSDYRRLSEEDEERFRQAVRVFNEACDRFIATRDPSAWPASLRVKQVRGAPGVWEMTWSFSGPDGRATWEWTSVTEGSVQRPAIRWRRIGDHRTLKDP